MLDVLISGYFEEWHILLMWEIIITGQITISMRMVVDYLGMKHLVGTCG